MTDRLVVLTDMSKSKVSRELSKAEKRCNNTMARYKTITVISLDSPIQHIQSEKLFSERSFILTDSEEKELSPCQLSSVNILPCTDSQTWLKNT